MTVGSARSRGGSGIISRERSAQDGGESAVKNVSIVGGGNVGTNTAFFVAENRAASVTLVDVREGITTGKALDLMEAAPIRGYDTWIKGADSIQAIEGSEV